MPAYLTFLHGSNITCSNSTVVLTWTHSTPAFELQTAPRFRRSPGQLLIVTNSQNTALNIVSDRPKVYRLAEP